MYQIPHHHVHVNRTTSSPCVTYDQPLYGSIAAQVCTGVMLHGYPLVKNLCGGLQEFMKKHNFESVEDFRGRSLPYFTTHKALYEMQQEAMNEIGNIVLNACIGSISNSIGTELEVSLPVFYHDRANNILGKSVEGGSDIVLFITIDMTLKKSEVVGYMAFLLGPRSLKKLQNQLKDMLAKMM